jgi:hypothetical protein
MFLILKRATAIQPKFIASLKPKFEIRNQTRPRKLEDNNIFILVNIS